MLVTSDQVEAWLDKLDEDRSRIRAGKLPRNLACLSNVAIAVVRMRGRFEHQPQAHRHYASRQADALRDILAPASEPAAAAPPAPLPGAPAHGSRRERRFRPPKRLSADSAHGQSQLPSTVPTTPASPFAPAADNRMALAEPAHGLDGHQQTAYGQPMQGR